MILKILSVYDSKVQAYCKPFTAHTRGEAVRMFSDAIKDPESMFAKHPEDFILFDLGEWDDSTAVYTCLPAPHSLGVGTEYVE